MGLISLTRGRRPLPALPPGAAASASLGGLGISARLRPWHGARAAGGAWCLSPGNGGYK